MMLEIDSIETPENVLLDRRLAGIGTRFIAGFLDNLLIAIVLLLLVIALMILVSVGVIPKSSVEYESNPLGAWAIALVLVFIFLVYWGYFAFFEYVTNGQTPGKKYSHIRVVKREGGAITFTDIAVRNLIRVVDSLPFGYAVAGLCMFITKRCQRLGDLAAGTVVADESVADYSSTEKRAKQKDKKRKKGRSVESEDMPDLEPGAEHLQKAQLLPDEYRVLVNYWSRRHDLETDARVRILQKVMHPILRRHGRLQLGGSLISMERYAGELLHPPSDRPLEEASSADHSLGETQP